MSTAVPRLRFAPSPNGRLHLGHAYSALFTQHAAASLGGATILRIEDIDPIRSRPEFDAAIIADLAWLGLRWLEPVMRQSSRMKAYAKAAEVLRARDLIYPCFCSRREVVARASKDDPDGAPLYAGSCRLLSRDEVDARLARGEAAQWRLKMDRAAAEAGPLDIQEAPAGDRHATWSATGTRPANPAAWGDAVIIRKDTPTSYHLSVVVDDAWQGITHVTRGMDLFAATDLHVLLQRLLGLPTPVYCHHRLLRDGTGEKLAKSKGSQSLADLRAAGWSAGDVRRCLGFVE
jgi:glutamyl-Q tRNA(Asp) synthetase